MNICHNLYPARGRKLAKAVGNIVNSLNLPQPLPRKGTETDWRTNGFNFIGIAYLPQPLPRKGTETKVYIGSTVDFKRFATTFTPQGDGNCKIFEIIYRFNFICHNLYPARGRKLPVWTHPNVAWAYICHNLYPARGRKRGDRAASRVRLLRFATTFTPQGDGNFSTAFKSLKTNSNLPQPLPRKGTET